MAQWSRGRESARRHIAPECPSVRAQSSPLSSIWMGSGDARRAVGAFVYKYVVEIVGRLGRVVGVASGDSYAVQTMVSSGTLLGDIFETRLVRTQFVCAIYKSARSRRPADRCGRVRCVIDDALSHA